MDDEQINSLWNWCKERINVDHVFNVFVYFGLIVVLLITLEVEYGEIYSRGERPQTCKLGEGASYFKGKPSSNDDRETLYKKIRISCAHDTASVYWRRTIIFSIIVSFILLLIVLQRLPNGVEFAVAVLILYLSLYIFLLFYQHSVSEQALEQVRKSIKYLQKLDNC